VLRTDLDDTLDLIGLLAGWRATALYVGTLCTLVTAFVLDFTGWPRLRNPKLAQAYTQALTTSLVLLAPLLLALLMFVLFLRGFSL
jgi:hypothetical protein